MKDIDWSKVVDIMLLSFYGQRISEAEQRFLELAHKTDPKRYSKEHDEMKKKEIKAIKGLYRKLC